MTQVIQQLSHLPSNWKRHDVMSQRWHLAQPLLMLLILVVLLLLIPWVQLLLILGLLLVLLLD